MTRIRLRARRAGGAATRLTMGLGLFLVLAACASDTIETSIASTSDQAAAPPTPIVSTDEENDECAHVVAVEVSGDAAGYVFSVTVASTETGWDKYADLWTVAGLDGTVHGERVLAHPHVEEQPFTRSLGGVSLPAGTTEVVIAARDSVLGFCGDTMIVTLEDAR